MKLSTFCLFCTGDNFVYADANLLQNFLLRKATHFYFDNYFPEHFLWIFIGLSLHIFYSFCCL